MADRYLLLPLMAPAVLLAYWSRLALERSRHRTLILGLLCAYAVILGTLTVRQVSFWHDSLRLWQRAVAMQPESPRAWYQLSVTHEELEDYDAEAVALARLLELEPGHVRGLNNLGINKFRRGQNRGQIIRLYEELIRRHPGESKAMHNLAVVLIAEGRHDEAVEWLQRALRIRPDYCGALLNLGRAHRGRGDSASARRYFEQALACNPQLHAARRFLEDLQSM